MVCLHPSRGSFSVQCVVLYGQSPSADSKIVDRRDGKSPDLKVNDKKLQTANLVYIFYDIILSVNASTYGILAINMLTSFPIKSSFKGDNPIV